MNVNEDKLATPTKEGLISFLQSSFIKGIGKVYANRIAEATGMQILEEGFDFENKLKEIAGLSDAKIEEIKHSFSPLKTSPTLLALLFSTGLSDSDIDKIISHYRNKVEKVILDDPYEMVEEVFKLSFFSADKIGKFLGIEKDDIRRLQGAVLTAIKFYAEAGSMFATESEALKTASRITGVEEEKIKPAIENLIKEERIIKSHGGLYLPVYYKAEKEGAKKIVDLIKNRKNNDTEFPLPTTDREGHLLSDSQIEAIKTVIENPVTVITGGPGSGKTTTIRGIIKLLEDQDKKVILAAPTGRAAKRMSDLSGREAKTIHRLLGYSKGRGYKNKAFDADILIIDEASMLEQVLFNHLLQALKNNTKIVLVGDIDQLPAIGAGDVLRDMIKSGTIPVVTLTENFRHKEGSRIASSAANIRNGETIQNQPDSDFMIITESTSSKIHKRLLNLITKELPDKFGIKPADIQVVTPQQEGSLGAKQLNKDIQAAVNATAPGIQHGVKLFKLGDRVMQTSNSSQRNTYNGEIGIVSEVDPENNWIEVTFSDGKKSRYSKREFKELTLSYATTVHKLQGSETDYLVMPISLGHRNMLYRNLLYTGVSRAKKLCVIVGEEKAIKTAVDNPSPSIRNSNFKLRLQEGLPILYTR